MSDQGSNKPSGSGQISNPFKGLDVDKVKNAGLPTQLMLGSSVVYFLFSFFNWYGGTASFGGFSASKDWNAWHYFPGFLSVLLMLAVGVVALLMLLQGPTQLFVFGALGGSALSILLIIWYWAASAGETIPSGPGVTSGADFGLYICLIAAAVATAGAFMTFQAWQRSHAAPGTPAT